MSLVKEVFTDKLVIMVTHNELLAKDVSDRIIRLQDGKVIDDTNPYTPSTEPSKYVMKKTAMSFFTALRLSLSNLKTKFARTIITAFAGSIGIIGIALVLALSNGFGLEIGNLERNTLFGLPITLDENVQTPFGPPAQVTTRDAEFSNQELIDLGFAIPFDPQEALRLHRNTITDEYIEYVEVMDPTWTSLIRYTYGVNLNFLNIRDGEVTVVNRGNLRLGFQPIQDVLEQDYNILSGRALLGVEIRLAPNSIFYEQNEDNEFYSRVTDLESVYDESWSLSIVGVVQLIEPADFPDNSVLLYSFLLPAAVIEDAQDSDLVRDQLTSDFYLLGDPSSPLSVLDSPRGTTRTNALRSVGAISTPSRIDIFPSSFDNKLLVKDYLDAWNDPSDPVPIDPVNGDTWESGDGFIRTYNDNRWEVTGESDVRSLADDDRILYQDLAQTITNIFGELVSTISVVLVIFAAISLVVSSIMIGIITYVSVIERTKEIGILRALGARKKDISRLFNAETVIIGITAGTFGVLLTYGLSFPLNALLIQFVDTVEFDLVILRLDHAIALVLISTTLTLISGLIPSSIAAKKDPVEALRVE